MSHITEISDCTKKPEYSPNDQAQQDRCEDQIQDDVGWTIRV